MNNNKIKHELLEIIEDLVLKDGDYLKIMNLLGSVDFNQGYNEEYVLDLKNLLRERNDVIDGLVAQIRNIEIDNGNLRKLLENQVETSKKVIGVNFLVSRDDLYFPELNEEQRKFLKEKWNKSKEWRYKMLHEKKYIFNVSTNRFVDRNGNVGQLIEREARNNYMS